MILVIVAMAITLLIGIIWAISQRDIDEFLISILISMIVGLGALACTDIVGSRLPDDKYAWQEESTPLYALADSGGMYGHFFLGTGTVKSMQYYYYIIETERGYIMQSVPASRAYVKYTDGEPALITTSANGFADSTAAIYALPDSRQYYTFCVPEGTIVQNYVVDLQ